MADSNLIAIPVVPRKLDEKATWKLLNAIRHNMQQIVDNGIPQATFNRQYGSIVSSVTSGTGIPNAPASPEAKTPPAAKNFAATSGYTTITLTWFMQNSNWTHFQIFRSTTSSVNDTVLIGSATTETFTDAPPAADTTYYYWVRAVNGTTLGPLSGPVSGLVENVGLGDGLTPSEPQNLRAVGNIRSVQIQWSASISNDVIAYEVFRDTTAWADEADVLANAETLGTTGATFWVDSRPAGDSTTYYYWVRSRDVEDLVSSLDTSPTQRGAAAITADTIDITPEATSYVRKATQTLLDMTVSDTWYASTANVSTSDPAEGGIALVFVNAKGLHDGGGGDRMMSVRLKEENLTDVTTAYEYGGEFIAQDGGAEAACSWTFIRELNDSKQYRWTPEFKYDLILGASNEEVSGIEVVAMVIRR